MKKSLNIYFTLMLTATLPAFSQDIWSGGGNNNLSDPNDWAALAAPSTGDSLDFTGSTQTSPNNDLATNLYSFSGITFDGSASGFDLVGNDVWLSGGITNASGTQQLIDLNLVLTGPTAINTTSGDIAVGNTTGQINGPGTLTVNGPGTLTVSTNNSGGTTINSGANMVVNNINSSGNGSYTLAGGSLLLEYGSWYSPSRNFTFTADSSLGVNTGSVQYSAYGRYDCYGLVGSPGFKWTVIGNGRFQMSGGSNHILAGSVDVTAPAVLSDVNGGNTTISGLGTNTITVENGAALRKNNGGIVLNPIVLNGGAGPDSLGALVANQEAYAGQPSTIVATFSNNITLNADSTLGAIYGSMLIAGNISGYGSLTKVGNYPLILTGTNSNYGTDNSGTYIDAGILQLGSPYALSTNGNVTIGSGSGATLDLNGNSYSGNYIGDDYSGLSVIDNSSANPATLTLSAGSYFTGAVKNSGGGALSIVNVSGSTSLEGANTYTGSTLVEGGTLDMILSTSKTNGGLVLATNGGTLSVHLSAPTALLPASGVTLGNNSGDTSYLTIDLNSYGNVANPIINATNGTGVLSANGTIYVTINNPANIVVGSIHLIKYTSLSGIGTSFVLNTIAGGVGATIVTNAANHSIDLSVTFAPITTWTARVNTNWDFTTTNWTYAGIKTNYQDSQAIYFDNTASNFLVNLTTTFSPGSVLVSSSSNYLFTGSGSLSGGALTKSGSGTLILDVNSSTYASTTIGAGTLQVGNNDGSGDLGTGSVNDNGTLAFNRTNNYTVQGLITGTGSLVQNGSNSTLTVSQVNTYSGGTVVNQGTVKLGAANVLGTNSVGNLVTVNAGASLDLNGQYLGAPYPVVISGSGAPGRLGALTSVSGGGGMNLGYGNIGINNLVLAADATIGESSCNWQIGKSGVGISGNGHILTMSMLGGNSIYLWTNALTSPSQVIIGAGKVYFCENTNALGSAAVTLTNGGGFDTWNNNTGTGYSTGNPGLSIFNNVTVGVGGGTLNDDSAAYNGSHGNYDTYAGSFTLNANLTLNNTGVRGGGISKITVTGPVSGTGGIICNQYPTNISTLSGVCTYSGPTIVNSGYLLLSGSQQGGGAFTNNDAAVLDVPNQLSFSTVPMSTLALVGTNLGATLSFSRLSQTLTTNALITATNLVLTGTNTVIIPGLAFVNAGDYPIIKYTTLSGGLSNLVLGVTGVRGLPGVLSNNVANGSIDLVIPGGTPVVWAGGTGSTATNWDIATTANWKTNGVATFYQQSGVLGDAVTFNDSSSVTNVYLTTSVSPTILIVNNTNDFYTFTGSSITGGASLLKEGTGTLFLTNGANTFTGGATIVGGTLKLGNAGSLNNSSGTATISGNGALDFNYQNPTALACTISGTGFNGLGTLVANYTNAAAGNGPASVTLAGSATIGGTNRWDIRNGVNQLNSPTTNYVLTKVGAGYVGLVGTTVSPNLGDIHINGGTLSYQTSTTGLGNTNCTVFVGSGATLDMYAASVPLSKGIVLSNSATISTSSGGNNNILGPLTIASGANVSFNGGNGLTLSCPVNIPSGCTVNNNANYYATIVYSNTISGSGTFNMQYQSYIKMMASNTFSGNLTVPQCNSGAGTVLFLIGNGSISAVPTIYMQGIASGQASPGHIDVSGRVDGTLTLSPYQTLRGDLASTVKGTVVVPAGSTITVGGDGNTNCCYMIMTNLTTTGGVLSFDVLSTTNDQIWVPGALNLSGGGTIRAIYTAASGLTNNARFHLINFGSKTGSAASNLKLALNGPHFAGAHLDDTTTPNWVDLVIDNTNIVAPQTLTWAGDGVFNFWDPGTSANWLTNSSAPSTAFYNGDYVSFTDPASNSFVNLNAALSPAAVTVNTTHAYILGGSGSISGSNTTLAVSGSGSLTLSNANTYTGGTTISAGTVNLYNVNALGTWVVTNNGTINLYANGGTGNVTPSGLNTTMAGSGIVNVTLGTGTGTTILNGTNSGFTGTLNIGVGAAAGAGKSQINTVLSPSATLNVLANGTVYIATAVTNSGSVNLYGGYTGEVYGQLRLDGSANWAGPVTLLGAMTNAGDGQIGSAGSGTVSGNISGSVPLVTSGSGSITLSGSNTYSGGLNVYQGTTTLLNNQAGATGGVLMCTNNANATTLNLGSSSQVSPTLVAAGSGNLFQMGTLYPAGAANSSAQTLNVNGASGFPTTVTNASPLVVARASTLTIGNYATWNQSGGLNVAAYGGFGATLYVGNGAGSSGILTYTANSPIQLSEYSLSVSPSILNINGGMLITGQPFNFNGASTTAGDVGRLCIYNGGMLTLSANIPQLTTGDPTGQVQLPTASVGIINTAGYSTTLGTGVTGSGSLLAIGSGTLTLAGTNTYTGTTVISNSTLVVAAVGVVPTNAVTVATNATLGGSGIVAGVTTVQAGGSLAPSVGNGTNTATLTFSNSLFIGGNLLVNLNKSLAQSNDLIVVKGSVLTNTAAGILTVTNYGPALVVGDTFTLFSQAVSNGAALSIVGGSPAGYAVTWTNKLAVNGSISVLAVTATASTNALLTSLVLSSAATFTPAFSSNITSYAATENYGNSPTVTVINGNLNATNQLIYNGSPVGLLTSGVPSGALTLTLGGTNVINVKVTAQNGTTTNLYTVNVVEIPSQSQPQLTNSFNGTALTFSWPADHLGYRLLVQTNNLQNGVSGVASDWGTVAGSQTNTTTTITVPTTNLNEFYKLVYP